MQSTHASGPAGSIVFAGRSLDGPALVVGFAVAVCVVGLGFSLVVPAVLIVGLQFLGVELPLVLTYAAELLLTDLVGFGLATGAYLRLRGLSREYVHVHRPTRRDLGWMVGGSAAVLVLYFGFMAAAAALGAPSARSGISIAGNTDPNVLLLIAVLSFVLIAPMEELFFRGVVQETMSEAVPGLVAVVLASLLFAAVHVITLVGPLAGALVSLTSMFITSLVLGFAYLRSRNLLVNVVIHGTYNATLLLIGYVMLGP